MRHCFTELNEYEVGCCCKRGTSNNVRSSVKPQGERTRTWGSDACSSSQTSQGECNPTSPKTFTPPAYTTSSGVQLPAAIKGSSHSSTVTHGFIPRVAVASCRRVSRC